MSVLDEAWSDRARAAALLSRREHRQARPSDAILKDLSNRVQAGSGRWSPEMKRHLTNAMAPSDRAFTGHAYLTRKATDTSGIGGLVNSGFINPSEDRPFRSVSTGSKGLFGFGHPDSKGMVHVKVPKGHPIPE